MAGPNKFRYAHKKYLSYKKATPSKANNNLIKVNFLLQLTEAQKLVEGFHIQIRDLTWSKSLTDSVYDVITLAGGGTRSHTLSDLRPDTQYSIFILPYNKRVKGTPSNMKRVTTKEDGKTKKFFSR